MNKKTLTEADIRTKFITPALVGADGNKWNVMTQLREEIYFTKGRVIVRGTTVKRGEAKKADYILFYKPNIPIAVIEAKDNNHAVGSGMQQALEYAGILDVPFAYSSNGDAFLEHDRTVTGGVVDPRFFGGPVPWITVGEITKDTTKYLTVTATGLTDEGASRSRFINPGDLLLTNSGATLGVPKISKIRGCMNDGVAVLRLFHSFDLNDYAYLYLTHQTPAFRTVNQGMGQPNLNTPIIAGWFFPLPPVAKVDQLMTLVDQLETQLTASRAAASNLMEAAVAELTVQG